MNELKAFEVSHVRIPNSKFVILNCFVRVPGKSPGDTAGPKSEMNCRIGVNELMLEMIRNS